MGTKPRFIWGTAYNRLLSSPASTSVVVNISAAKELSINAQHIIQQSRQSGRPMTLKEREIVYNDPAMRLEVGEVESIGRLQNKPIKDNHSQRTVGSIVDGFMVDKSTIRVLGEVTDPETIAKIDAGIYRGLSVGYGRSISGETVDGLDFYEVSVCPTPFFDGCDILVSASREGSSEVSNANGPASAPTNFEVKNTVYNPSSVNSFNYSSSGIKSLFSNPQQMAAPHESVPQGGTAHMTPNAAAAPPSTTNTNVPPATSTATPAPHAAPPPATPAQPPATTTAPSAPSGPVDPNTFRELSEGYKALQAQLARIQQENIERQRPAMEKSLNILARVTSLSGEPSLPPAVQKFITDQYSSYERKDMSDFLSTVSNKFEEAGLKYEQAQSRITAYEQQNAELQRQLAESKALLEKQSLVLSESQRQATPTLPPPSSVLSDIFTRATPVDSLFGLNTNGKRSYDNFAAPSPSMASVMQQRMGLEALPKQLEIKASKDSVEESPAKRQRTDDLPPNILPSQSHIFDALMGAKNTINMRTQPKAASARY
jgi:hypothetical protein